MSRVTSDIPNATPMGAESVADGAMQDARFELAAAAAAGERANRPTHLIVIGAILVAVAVIAAGVSLSGRLASQKKLSRETGNADVVMRLVAEWKQIDEAQQQQGPKRGAGSIPIRTAIGQAATTAGMKTQPALPVQPRSPRKVGELIQNRLEYRDVRDESAEALLKWVHLAMHDVPGLEVFALSLAPDGPNWKMSVTFSRWERPGDNK